MLIYKILDIFFLVFHTTLILFNLFGWIYRKTKLFNLITIILTFLSWIVLGIFYGFGYCPFTDWHFEILRKLGETGLPNSYIAYLIERLTGFTPNPDIVDISTIAGLVFALIISGYVNFFRKGNN